MSNPRASSSENARPAPAFQNAAHGGVAMQRDGECATDPHGASASNTVAVGPFDGFTGKLPSDIRLMLDAGLALIFDPLLAEIDHHRTDGDVVSCGDDLIVSAASV
jgi:hypothetical protein